MNDGPARMQAPRSVITATGLTYGETADMLRADVDALCADLDVWADRDDSRPQADVTKAGHDAVDRLDRITRDLYAIRSRLVGEIRTSQDAAAARTDALLARLRAERGEGVSS